MTKYLRLVGLAALVAAPVAGIAGTAGASTHAGAHVAFSKVTPLSNTKAPRLPKMKITTKRAATRTVAKKAKYTPKRITIVPTWTGTPFNCTTTTIDSKFKNATTITQVIYYTNSPFFVLPARSSVGICYSRTFTTVTYVFQLNETAGDTHTGTVHAR